MKISLILPLFALSFFFQTNSCDHQNDPIVKWKGPNEPTDIVFFYKKGATYEDIESFQNTIIHKPHPEGRGYALVDGIVDLFSVRNSEYFGVGINFATSATPEQREKLKQSVKDSPIVYRLYENVVPNEIKDL